MPRLMSVAFTEQACSYLKELPEPHLERAVAAVRSGGGQPGGNR